MVQFLGLVGGDCQQQKEEQVPQPQLAHTQLLDVNRELLEARVVQDLSVEGPAVKGEAEDARDQHEQVTRQCFVSFLLLAGGFVQGATQHERQRHTGPFNQVRLGKWSHFALRA